MKNHNLKLFCLLFLVGFSSIYGQYTEVINSNKPGFSESPYSVGTGVYQFESNLFSKDASTGATFSIPKSFGFDVLFRTSFFLEKLELNTQISYQKDKVAFENIFTSHYNTSGFSKFTIAAKYLVYQQKYKDKNKEIRSWKRKNAFDFKRLIPSVAIYAGLNTNFVNDIYKTEEMTQKVGLLLQNNLSNQFNVISNFYFDKIGTDYPEFSYIITGTYNFALRWSTFLENETLFKENQNYTNLGTGVAYLFNKNLQINTSARFLLENKSKGIYGTVGISYRIDKHTDSYKELNEMGEVIKNKPVIRYNKKENGFFKRVFSIFTKKKKSARKRSVRNRNN